MNKKIEKYQDINGNVYQLTTELEKVILNDLIKETESVVELSDENIKLKNRIDKVIEYIENEAIIENLKADHTYITINQDGLLNILKGSDNND